MQLPRCWPKLSTRPHSPVSVKNRNVRSSLTKPNLNHENVFQLSASNRQAERQGCGVGYHVKAFQLNLDIAVDIWGCCWTPKSSYRNRSKNASWKTCFGGQTCRYYGRRPLSVVISRPSSHVNSGYSETAGRINAKSSGKAAIHHVPRSLPLFLFIYFY